MKKKKMLKMLRRADEVINQAYIVVSVMAMDSGRIDGRDVTRMLNNLAFYQVRKPKEVLPFFSEKDLA